MTPIYLYSHAEKVIRERPIPEKPDVTQDILGELADQYNEHIAFLKSYPAKGFTSQHEGKELLEGKDFRLQWQEADIYSKKGTKVKPIFKNGQLQHGYDTHKKEASKYLKEGQVYTIDRTDVDSWHTNFYLQEFPGISFNSVHFVNEKPIAIPIEPAKEILSDVEKTAIDFGDFIRKECQIDIYDNLIEYDGDKFDAEELYHEWQKLKQQIQ